MSDISKKWDPIVAEMDKAAKDMVSVLEGVQQEVNAASTHRVIDYITCRVKSADSVVAKLKRKNREISTETALKTLHDIIGVRVICSYQDDIYVVLKKIREIYDLKIIKVKDYIRNPKKSGYRSVHIIVKVENTAVGDAFAEIQLRTFAMNYWAKLDHQLIYKNESPKVEVLRGELKEYAVAIADIDKKFYKMRKRIEHLQ